MYRFLAKFYPKKLREDYVNLLRYSSIKINAYRFIGFTLSFGFLLSLAVAFYLGFLFEIPFLISFLGLFFLGQTLIYFWLLLRADAKAKFVEGILPDVLHLMASNLRAGLTTDKALLLSARPEFGPFQDELNRVGKEITTGTPIGLALQDIVKHIKSEKLDRTMGLIAAGLKSGGELASLLEQTAKNLRKEMLLDSRIRANVMMYVIFIFAALCFGAPMLFGLSSFLVEILSSGLGLVDIPADTAINLPLDLTDVSISVDFVVMFSVIFLATSSIMGGLILGLISKGKERAGIKFIPILMIISLAMFFLVLFAIRGLLSGLFEF